MGILKFLLVFLGIVLLIRIIIRLIFPVHIFKIKNQPRTNNPQPKSNVDEPRFTIEAEEVDYEIIEDKKDPKDEK